MPRGGGMGGGPGGRGGMGGPGGMGRPGGMGGPMGGPRGMGGYPPPPPRRRFYGRPGGCLGCLFYVLGAIGLAAMAVVGIFFLI
ncbi:MAG: hypothetical protein LIO92_07840 [Clostridiales bacterium]|nr:hypothetical protein [Clostridiales bacterium]